LIIDNCESQWVQMTGGLGSYQNIYSFANIGNNIFAGSSVGAWRSTNNGVNWTSIGLNTKEIRSVAVLGADVFASVVNINSPEGVYKSTNNGTNWTQTSLNNLDVEVLSVSGNNIYAGTESGVYRSSNNGANWTFLGLENIYVQTLLSVSSGIYVGADLWSAGGGVYASMDNGASWTFIGLYGHSVHSLAVMGTTLYANMDPNNSTSGVYVYNNFGTNWTSLGLGYEVVAALAVSGNNLFAGSSAASYPTQGTGGVYLSTNNGASWIKKNQGFFNEDMRVSSLLIANGYIFAGCSWRSPFRCSLSEIIGVQNISTKIPSVYSLSQNYPNPFNPTTVINFQLPGNNYVTLKVFDLMGREVQILVNESLKPGAYEVSFDGSHLTSGVYFYRLTTDNYTETKQMVLVR
jgi:hypothetical protein